MELGHPYEAIIDYNQAVVIETDYLDALFNRAYAYEDIGQFQNALDDVNDLKNLRPDSAFVYFYEGLVLTKLKKYDQAYTSLKRADRLDPLNPETLVNIATIHYFKNEMAEAGVKVQEALNLQPDNANAYNLLSLIALYRKDFVNALVEINRALDEVPGEPFFLNNRGYVYLQMDSLELAIEDINRSIVLNPSNGWAYRNKGIYQLKSGNIVQAINLFERAIQTGDFIDEIYYYLGTAHKSNQDLRSACTSWQKGSQSNEISSKRMLAQNCD